MEEKRACPRFRINQIIAYGPNREENVFAETINISRLGVSCSSAQMVDPMTNVYLMMHVPSAPGSAEAEHAVRCEGYVSHAHVEGGRCVFGVKITPVYEDDQPAFEAYISSLEAEAETKAEPEASGEGGASPSGN